MLKDYREFLRRLGKRACAGDASAQAYLSIVYEDGRGLKRDAEKAALWCIRAAKSGDRQSQYRASRMLDIGRGFEKKHERAAWFWLEKAAQAGHVQAQFDLGQRFLLGVRGVRKSVSRAGQYFRAAAERDHAEANYYLGFMHSRGLGFPPDAGAAHSYLQCAAELGSLNAKCALAHMCAHGEGCEVDNDRSYRLYEQAAAGGHAGAPFGLACLCLTTQKYKDARIWLELAAHNGIVPAQAVLAKFLHHGPKAFADKPTALTWCFIVQESPDADEDSLDITRFCQAELERALTNEQWWQSFEDAHRWLEKRGRLPLVEETDWVARFRQEKLFYESKKFRSP